MKHEEDKKLRGSNMLSMDSVKGVVGRRNTLKDGAYKLFKNEKSFSTDLTAPTKTKYT